MLFLENALGDLHWRV